MPIYRIPYLTTGRRLYALKLVLLVAQSLGMTALAAIIEAAIAHDTAALALEGAWARSRKLPTSRGRALEIDGLIDAVLAAIHTSLTSQISLLDSNSDEVKASTRILDALFPEGVVPLIRLPFEEQLATNTTIVERLTGDLAEDAKTANIVPFVSQLGTLNAAFAGELDQQRAKEIEYDVVQSAADRGNLFVRRIVAVVLGTYNGETDEDAAARKALLTPILEQCERVRSLRKGRRKAADVDPETGDELAPPSAA